MARPIAGTRLRFLLEFLLVLSVANVNAQNQLPSDSLSATPSATSSVVESSIALTSVVSESASGIRGGTLSIEATSSEPQPSVTDAPEASEDLRRLAQAGSKAIPNFGAAWQTAYQKAKSRYRYSLAEKVNVTTGVGWTGGRCVGNIPPIPFTSDPNPITSDSQFPGLCLEDAPTGVRFADYVSVFPNGINAAASWNRRLIRERGLLMGREFKGKGVNVALGPMMNMGRVPQGGRNWEGFGADLSSLACAKHLVASIEQEYKRTMSSSEIDDRTEHEIYLHPFLRSIMAGTTSIMCSYNLINGTYACENSRIMNEVIREQYGFQGYILSDWQAQHSTMSAITGLDVDDMPGDVTFNSNTSYWRETLVTFVENGTIPESRVDDMATRILAGWYLLEQDSPSFPQSLNDHVDVQADHNKHIRELGAASIVVLKNENNALPLGEHGWANKKAERSIFIAGSNAGPGTRGPNAFPDHGGLDGHLAVGWGSGTAYFTYLVTVSRELDHTSVAYLLDDFDLQRAGDLAKQKDAAIVFIASDSGEEYITLGRGDDLVLAVAAQNNNTIVVVNSVGPLLIEPWIDHPMSLQLFGGPAWYREWKCYQGRTLWQLEPQRKLPYTIAKRLEDVTPLSLGGGPDDIIAIPYTEGLNIDYRGFDAFNITPRFEFGFGLSYTTFEYSQLSISKKQQGPSSDQDLIRAWEGGEATPQLPGISRAFWLHQPAYEVTFNVKNTGPVYGGDIAQLYLNFPTSAGEPPAVLKGFDNVELHPGQFKPVTITLSRYDLSIWDVEKQGWRKPAGEIGVTISRSSRDPKLTRTIPL
ncbi:cellulose-binding beta-glucosidase [Coprinopsis sp. MPI-PUGE-AT-0042]|nr:cellulose-binding beta-glucosidase [Coprinopsis sp. MPI-PUGE-AT-0042]